MKKEKTIYLISPEISWTTFKKLQKKFVQKQSIEPVGIDKTQWELLRCGRIVCWFAEDMPGDMGIGLGIPKRYEGWKMMEITNKTQKREGK